jgi:hypothetical protein
MNKIEIETRHNINGFKVEGDLLSLIEGVAYIQNCYKEYEGFTQDKIIFKMYRQVFIMCYTLSYERTRDTEQV